jgi:cytochrome c5
MSQQDDAFVRTFIMVLAALVVFTISVFVLAQIMGGGTQTKGFEAAEVAERTKPVGEVKTAAADTATTAEAPVQKSGEEIYNTACMACHSTGAAGAPKFGDSAAWAPRLAKGKEAILNSALNGLNAMPPRGGNASLSDEDIKAAVDHMLASVQAEATAPEATPPVEEQPAAPEATPPAEEQPAAPEATPPAEEQPAAPEATPPAEEQPAAPEATPPAG